MIIFWKKIPNDIELKLIEICYEIHKRALITNSHIKELLCSKYKKINKICIQWRNSYWTAKFLLNDKILMPVVENPSIFNIFSEILLFFPILLQTRRIQLK